MFEHRHAPLLPFTEFARRMVKYAAISAGIMGVSLGIGIVGYRITEGMPWIDAFVNAAMIMGGMGPVGELHTWSGKFFAGCYALYCGLVLIVAVGVLAAPLFHRFLHHFHMQVRDANDVP